VWRPRPAHTPYRVEVQETRSCGQYDPCREQGRGTTPQGIPDNGKHGHGPQNRHGGAPQGERFLFKWKREAPKQGACVPVMARDTGCLAGIRSACGAHQPLAGVENVETKPIRREGPEGRRGKGMR
jgi:hypothetical protein